MERSTHIYINKEAAIEYSIVGTGMPILVFHGGHSNCNEDFGYNELIRAGYSIITPSRAGYGNTSSNIGENLKSACTAYVELLNHLKLEKVHVIAVSAGGPSGIFFAAHYPERVRSLTLGSAVTKKWLTPKDIEYKAAKILFRPILEKYTWKLLRLLSNSFPKYIFKQMTSSFSKLQYSRILTYLKDDDLDQFQKMINRQRSGHGFMIDLSLTDSISQWDLQAIKCPTLILHSKNDRTVSIEHAYYANNNIFKSKLVILDTWGHLIWLGKGSEILNEALLRFLKDK